MEKITDLTTTEQKPSAVVIGGRDAATELTKIVSSREKKLVMAGKQYLFFEDWQTIGKFYGVTAKVIRTEELKEEGKLVGFIACAVAVVKGEEISGADAECTYDEPNWQNKPRFQLRSMAQTRACAKALRNCLGWVAVLAGYEPTPAEEIQEVKADTKVLATQAQLKKIFAASKQMGYETDHLRSTMIRHFKVGNSKDLTREQASEFIQMIESGEGLQNNEELPEEPSKKED